MKNKSSKLGNIVTVVFTLLIYLISLPLLADEADQLSSTQIEFDVSIYYEDRPLTPPDNAKNIPSWLSQLNPVDSISLTGGQYWYHLRIPAQPQQAEWVINVNNSIIEYVDYYWYNQSKFAVKTSGYYQPGQYAFQYGKDINLEANTSYEVLIRIESRYFASQPTIEITEKSVFQQNTLIDNVLIISLLGALFALGLYNLFVYAGSKDKSHLFYSLYLFSYFLGWALVFQIPNALFNIYPIELIYIPFFALPLVGGYFCITFLKLNHCFPVLAKILKINGIISFALFPTSIFAIGYAHSIATVMIGTWIITAIIAGVKSWRNGFRPAAYFVAAFMSLLIPACFILPANIGLLPDLVDNAELLTLIGGTVDAIFLAFALADRLTIVTQKNIELTSSLENTVNKRTQELTETNFRLEQSNIDLLQASEIKGQFLATMSHEIRTPLTSIIGYADGILLGDIDKSEQDRVIRIITENGNHLLNIINDILDISKIEANKLDFESISTPLFPVLAQVESVVGKRARDKGLAFHLEYQYPLPAQIITDPTRLRQILFNLTNNAIKFTEKGYIGLGVSVTKEQLTITVKDSGEGLSVEQQQLLFEPFSQGDSSTNRRFGGTGLGLSISQSLAHGLNGKITVKSKPSNGSCFTLNMKLQLPEDVSWINNISEIWQSTPVKSVKQVSLPNFAGYKVLLADDHPSNRELIAILLKRMNINVIEAEDGKQALDALFYQSVDLILLDIHMPKMDGPEALKKIRLSGNNTPVIALTANNMKHEIDHYMCLGFSDHLAKPIYREQFIDKISVYLTGKGDVDNLIYNGDILNLVSEYQADLIQQIDKIQLALEQRDLVIIGEIAHRIRGSAGSFGFDLLGERFKDIEHCASQDDEISVTYELPKTIQLARLCTNLPGVNIPQAIINHQNSINKFLNTLYLFIYQSGTVFSDLKAVLENTEVNSALVHLYKILPTVTDCALEPSIQALRSLEELIKSGSWKPEDYLDLFSQVEQQITLLKTTLPDDLPSQIH